MEIKKLDCFLTAAQLGSLSKAAKQLNYTQSGITHMMNSVEKELGFHVMVRDSKGIHLTDEGEQLIPTVRQLVEKYREFEQAARQIDVNSKKTLIIGSYTSIALIWLPEITKSFRALHPNVNLEFRDYTVAGMRRAIRTGEIDIGFGSRSRHPDEDIMWRDLRNDPLLAILPNDYDAEGPFPITEFTGKEFLMPSYGFARDILRFLDAYNVKPIIKSSSVEDSVIVSMVGCGLGLSILSELVMQTGDFKQIKALPLEPEAYRTLGIAFKPQNAGNKYIKDFIAVSEEFIKKYYGSGDIFEN